MSAEKRPGRVNPTSGKFNLYSVALMGAAALTGFGAGAAVAQPVVYGGKVQEARLGADSGGRYSNRYEDNRFSRESVERFHDRVEWALSRGALSRGEADRLHFRATALDDLARAMARRDGLDYYEREDLDNRFADLRSQFRRLVWDRDYRGAYREEWRSSRDREERFWRSEDRNDRGPRDDDRSDNAARDDYAARVDRAPSELKRGDDDWEPPELGVKPPAAQVEIPPPQPYRAQQPIPPATRKPSPAQKPTPAPSERDDGQPFKDGRDFH